MSTQHLIQDLPRLHEKLVAITNKDTPDIGAIITVLSHYISTTAHYCNVHDSDLTEWIKAMQVAKKRK